VSEIVRPDDLGTLWRRLERRVGTLERRPFRLPLVAGSPADVADGDMWIDTSTNVLKVRINGVTKSVTVT